MGYFVAAAAVVLVIVAVLLAKMGNTPSVAMFTMVERNIRDVQRRAERKILPEKKDGEVSGFDEQTMNDLSVTVNNVIRFVYSIEHHEQGLLHTVSSQLTRRKNKKYQAQCMLIVMLVLNRELGESGIKQEHVKFDISESELGTQYVRMFLSPAQHAMMVEKSWKGAQQGHRA